MAGAGIDDILIPYNIVGQPKLRRLTDLARQIHVMVAVDSGDVAAGISRQTQADAAEVGVLIGLDTGGKRTGVQSPEAALELGKRVMDLPGLELKGIVTFPSDIGAAPFIRQTVSLFRDAGLPCPVISGGGTGREVTSKEIGCTETRSGSYVYEGMTRVTSSSDLSSQRCALRVVVTVVSVPTQDRVIVDGGMKTFRAFPPNPYGLIVEHPQARMYGMSVEHGHVDVSRCDHQFHVGEKLSVIPQHQGLTTNLHDEVVGVRDGQVKMTWQVRGRGKVK